MASADVPQVLSEAAVQLPLMGARLGWLEASWPVFKQTGLPLIGSTNGVLHPIPVGDDIGLYALAPVTAQLLHLSLHNAVCLLMLAFAGVGVVAAILQLWTIFKDWPTRIYAAVAVCLTALLLLFVVGDIYAMGAAASFILLPLCAVIALRALPLSLRWLPLALLIGVLVEGSNLVRSNSGTAGVIAVALAILLHRATSLPIRALLLAGIVAGIAAMSLLGHSLVTARDGYLMAHRTDYKPIPSAHPKWHSIYIGFGFLANSYGIQYRDDIAMDAARKIDPALAAPAAEEWQYDLSAHEVALRQATFALVKAHPLFVVRTLFAKGGVILAFVLLFGNLGLLGLRRLAAMPRLAIPLVLALALSAAPAVLVQPSLDYLTMLIASLAVAAAISVGLMRQNALSLP